MFFSCTKCPTELGNVVAWSGVKQAIKTPGFLVNLDREVKDIQTSLIMIDNFEMWQHSKHG